MSLVVFGTSLFEESPLPEESTPDGPLPSLVAAPPVVLSTGAQPEGSQVFGLVDGPDVG